jgi:hypothetical protein
MTSFNVNFGGLGYFDIKRIATLFIMGGTHFFLQRNFFCHTS